MKRCLLIIMLFVIIPTVYAQTAKELSERRKEMMKLSKEELNEKSSKSAGQEAKTYEKEGWKVAPGSLPMKTQLDKSYAIQQQYDENFESKFMMGQGISQGTNYDAARMQAIELAKQELAGMIETTIEAQTQSAVANKQLTQDEAYSIAQTIQRSKSEVAQHIGKVIIAVELYRDIPTGKEVLVRIAYNTNSAKQAALEAMREELTKTLENLNKKINEIMGAN